jgi:hypothetical protein
MFNSHVHNIVNAKNNKKSIPVTGSPGSWIKIEGGSSKGSKLEAGRIRGSKRNALKRAI